MTLGLFIMIGALAINYNILLDKLEEPRFVYVDPTIHNELVVDDVEVNELPEIERYYKHIESVPVFPNGDPYDR